MQRLTFNLDWNAGFNLLASSLVYWRHHRGSVNAGAVLARLLQIL